MTMAIAIECLALLACFCLALATGVVVVAYVADAKRQDQWAEIDREAPQ